MATIMTKTAATTGTTRLRLARIICTVSSLGISRAGAIVPETKTQEVFQPGSSCVLPQRLTLVNRNDVIFPMQMQLNGE